MLSVDKVIAVAKEEVGYLEKRNGDLDYLYQKTANAGDKNYTKYGYEMHKIYPEVMDYPAYWCDCFVDWCFYKAYGIANAKKLLGGNFDDYTVASAQLYKNKNAYFKTPQVGDQIFFNNGKRICHTGIVIEVTSSKVYTIEGNTSGGSSLVANGGGVAKKSYALSYAKIDGYGRPAYEKQPSFTPHWERVDGIWYYRIAENENAHGWKAINNHWYFFDDKGRMLTDWQEIDGKWYYFQPSGDLEGALYKTDENGVQGIWEL